MTITSTGNMQAADAAEVESGLTSFDERQADVLKYLAYLCIVSALALTVNFIATGASPLTALPGMAILVAVSIAGLQLAKMIPFRVPSVAWISLLAIIITIPGVPGSAWVADAVGKVNFLALATPVLAYAGLALTATEFRIARTAGWKLVIVAISVMLGTYLGSVVIADLSLRIAG